MRRLLIATALVAAFPLSATADTCIDGELGGGLITSRSDVPEDTPVRASLVGDYLNVYIGPENPDLFETMEGVLSVEVPADASGFSACESGLVTFTFPEVAPDPVSAPVQPAPVVVDIVELWRPWTAGSAV